MDFKMDAIPTPKLIKKKSRFDKVYNHYDLSKEYHRGYIHGSLITIIICVFSICVGRLF